MKFTFTPKKLMVVKDINKVENELIDIQKYKNEIKNWHYR